MLYKVTYKRKYNKNNDLPQARWAVARTIKAARITNTFIFIPKYKEIRRKLFNETEAS